MMKKNRISLCFIIAGLLCIAAALILFVNNIVGSRHAQIASERIVGELSALIEENGDMYLELPTDNPDRAMPALTVDGCRYAGILSIPALELELPVAAEFSYDGMKSSPCLYSGSVYGGNMVIAAHNYGAHFGRIGSLMPGDEVFFTDAEAHRYAYEVCDMETLNPDQREALIQSSSKERELTLFTCNYSGAARVVVRCKSV